jgi:hypothetical protein
VCLMPKCCMHACMRTISWSADVHLPHFHVMYDVQASSLSFMLRPRTPKKSQQVNFYADVDMFYYGENSSSRLRGNLRAPSFAVLLPTSPRGDSA